MGAHLIGEKWASGLTKARLSSVRSDLLSSDKRKPP